ncbi:hypothetical protein K474DRAFT_1711934 [Panus rudis PR-1116 ss-1]|nr:hypothetical protein K474DRAFT_1711934 [Panus rudis PR-1116 ss-1]
MSESAVESTDEEISDITTTPVLLSNSRRLLTVLHELEDRTDPEFDSRVHSLATRAARTLGHSILFFNIEEYNRCQILEIATIRDQDMDKVSMDWRSMYLDQQVANTFMANTLEHPVMKKLQARADWLDVHGRVGTRTHHMLSNAVLHAALKICLSRRPEKDITLLPDVDIGWSSDGTEQPVPVHETGTEYSIAIRGRIQYLLLNHPISSSLQGKLRT